MTDMRIQFSEEMVGAGHPAKADTINRLALVGHNNNGTHKTWVDIKEAGAAGNGTTDDTSLVQTAATAAAGKTLYVPVGYNFKVSATINANCNIIGGGTITLDATLAPSVRTPVISLTGDNHTVEGVTFSMGYVAKSVGILVSSATNTKIRNCRFINAKRGAVQIGSTAIDTSIVGNRFEGAGYQILYDDALTGDADSGSSGLTIQGNTFKGDPNNAGNVGGDHIEINAPNAGFQKFDISGNQLYDAWASDTSAGIGIGLSGVYNGSVTNNLIVNTSQDGIHVEEGGRGSATGAFGKSYNVMVKGNTIINPGTTGGTKYTGIAVQYSLADIIDNTVYGAGTSGIVINTYSSKGTPASLTDAGIRVDGNTVRNCQRVGVYLIGPQQAVVRNNNIHDNGQETANTYSGVRFTADTLSQQPTDTEVSGNRISGTSHKYQVLVDAGVLRALLRDNFIPSGATGDLSDSGTNTIRQFNRGANGNQHEISRGVLFLSGTTSTFQEGLAISGGKKINYGGGPDIVWGSGSPESVVTASAGSVYFNSSGGAGTTMYVKESGAGNTGWIAK